jgi:hypothetical protein
MTGRNGHERLDHSAGMLFFEETDTLENAGTIRFAFLLLAGP